jgi:hypothetical protein
MFPAEIGAASAAILFYRRMARRERRPNNWNMTVNTMYVATMVFCAVAILVVFELIDQRLPSGSSSVR